MYVPVPALGAGRWACSVEPNGYHGPDFRQVSMNVVLVNYFYNPELETADRLLNRYASLVGWAEGLQAAGARSTVLQRFHQNIRMEHWGVLWQFVADGFGPRLRAWQVPVRLHRMARALCVGNRAQNETTVIHVNGLLFPLQVRALREVLPRECAIAVQHHAEKPRQGLRGLVQGWGLKAADGFLFAGRELGQPFVKQGAIRSMENVYQIMEGSSWFSPHERTPARALTGMHGTPVILWVGRLNANKDPLTVLTGFEQVVKEAPGARLYMAYSTEDLLPQVRAYLGESPILGKSVTLLGSIPHADLENYYNSADFFILGSHYEGSGYALAEALACGVIPVVTDIPSFRMMTDGGRIGGLWTPGDAGALREVMLDLLRRPWPPMSAAARGFFKEHLSFPAIGRQAMAIYEELAARRGRSAT
jgi:glycosyltransferase involved in cell wall biosynthesis